MKVKLISIVLIGLFAAQVSVAQSVDIPAKKFGFSFGNSKKFTGFRFNFRDKDVEKINGVNTTIWMPYETKTKKGEEWADYNTGKVNGIALGVPFAAGEEINGIALGVGVAADGDLNGINVGVIGSGSGGDMNGVNFGGLGTGAGGDLNGINIGGLGLGSGGDINGITLAGLGAGSGDDINGITLAGLGLGSGGDINGITVAGMGLGSGGSLTGVNLAGLGMGSAQDITGLNVAGIGLAAGEDVKGISGALVGVGSGNNIVGLTVAGIGIGAGESVKGIALAGVGVGAPSITGLVVSAAAGAEHFKGIAIVPAFMKIEEEGSATGLTMSAVNLNKGKSKGLSIGLFNYSKELHGVQIGLLNHAANNPRGLRWLPFINMHLGKKNPQEQE